MINLDELEAFARAATPGKWKRDDTTVYALDVTGKCNRFSARVQGGYVYGGMRNFAKEHTTAEEIAANAAYIAAANPAAVLSLIAEVRGLREAVRRLTTTYAGMEDGDGEPCPDVAFSLATLREYTNV